MADRTHIEWTDATWNVVTGCSVVSPGCSNCYAMRLAGTRLRHHPSRAGLTVDSKAGPVWNGQVRFNEAWLTQPLRWRRPRRIFVAAHGDLFHEGVTDEQLDRIFAVMALCPQHTFQVLTKRPERMRAYLTEITSERRARALRAFYHAGEPATRADRFISWPLPNVWLGVSVEDQARADERIPLLLATPAAVRWISAEPLLGPIDLSEIQVHGGDSVIYPLRWTTGCVDFDGNDHPDVPPIDWVVAGGESGPGARPMHPAWARQLRDQCAAAGVRFLFKQWGDWLPCEHVREGGRDSDWTPRALDGSGRVFRFKADAGESHCFHVNPSSRSVDDVFVWRFPKSVTGRLLDGRLHDAYPEARP